MWAIVNLTRIVKDVRTNDHVRYVHTHTYIYIYDCVYNVCLYDYIYTYDYMCAYLVSMYTCVHVQIHIQHVSIAFV